MIRAGFTSSGVFVDVRNSGPDTATGLVYLLDFVTGDQMREGGNPLYWLGVYEEEYRRTGEDWRISRQSLQFVWPQRMVDDGFLARQATPAPVAGRTDGPR